MQIEYEGFLQKKIKKLAQRGHEGSSDLLIEFCDPLIHISESST